MSVEKIVSINLRVWRQKGPTDAGHFDDFPGVKISTEASFLEMLDLVNEQLIVGGKEPIAFEHDCREGICGTCGFVVNGFAHGPDQGTTVCQLHMRRFKDGDSLTIEPWRARAFPVIRDLMVDRSAFDRIQRAGGYNSVNVGNAPDANSRPDRSRCGLGGLRRCCLYRLRCVRCCLPERLGDALRRRKGLAPVAAAAG